MNNKFAKRENLTKEYNVNASTISTILSSKAKILEHYEKNLAGPEKKQFAIRDFFLLKHYFLVKDHQDCLERLAHNFLLIIDIF
ncbi:hypothetical protein BpHYR1_015706 [Brachionus plicatilis]|uniref:HTH psq-type domain-containing protein n=1 Tax=Brachionus plicatilis TaxID=10195 RepID=A0A3M7RFX7_BRAPC|nr:hypothetical protein BpHYR1_015706 [Brachionus plicatilis]